ncbi:MAG: hypothetical protein K2X69_09865, partial [Silvanigrellaceae bacterium]|nr:hypothetical protein [Silvanigrellaceae bacterium]
SDLGWSIGTREEVLNENNRDDRDAVSLYDTLEYEIIPLYYSSKIPTEWIEKMKKSISVLTPKFSAHRMLADYISKSYLPAAKFHENWSIHSDGQIESLKKHIKNVQFLKEKWKDVQITRTELKPSDTVIVGENVSLQLEVHSPFPENWLEVSLVLENSDNKYGIHDRKDVNLVFVETDPMHNQFIYAIDLETTNPEIRTYTIRVCPNPIIFPEHLDLDLVAR